MKTKKKSQASIQKKKLRHPFKKRQQEVVRGREGKMRRDHPLPPSLPAPILKILKRGSTIVSFQKFPGCTSKEGDDTASRDLLGTGRYGTNIFIYVYI